MPCQIELKFIGIISSFFNFLVVSINPSKVHLLPSYNLLLYSLFLFVLIHASFSGAFTLGHHHFVSTEQFVVHW